MMKPHDFDYMLDPVFGKDDAHPDGGLLYYKLKAVNEHAEIAIATIPEDRAEFIVHIARGATMLSKIKRAGIDIDLQYVGQLG